ncbi:MAG: hypothetical protein U5R30_10325 [Deltaproteobacteria bacterium]|nr:hypothetical protein [Deltaproteobacteria bacterium]
MLLVAMMAGVIGPFIAVDLDRPVLDSAQVHLEPGTFLLLFIWWLKWIAANPRPAPRVADSKR